MVLNPNLEAMYGLNPTYFGLFERTSYSAYVERQLGQTVADKLALVAEELVWFSMDKSWAAFGSRELGTVVIARIAT